MKYHIEKDGYLKFSNAVKWCVQVEMIRSTIIINQSIFMLSNIKLVHTFILHDRNLTVE